MEIEVTLSQRYVTIGHTMRLRPAATDYVYQARDPSRPIGDRIFLLRQLVYKAIQKRNLVRCYAVLLFVHHHRTRSSPACQRSSVILVYVALLNIIYPHSTAAIMKSMLYIMRYALRNYQCTTLWQRFQSPLDSTRTLI